MRVFIDDLRVPHPDYSKHVLRTYDKAIDFLLKHKDEIDSITTDYDLGSKKNGLDILIFMKENNIEVRHINVHSTHKEGVSKMLKYLEDNFKNTSITFNAI